MQREIQGAAYRFGHTMVRPSYRANITGDDGQPFFGMIFDPAGQGQADPVDLRGGVTPAAVEAIVALHDRPVLRNLLITQAYHQLSRQLAANLRNDLSAQFSAALLQEVTVERNDAVINQMLAAEQ